MNNIVKISNPMLIGAMALLKKSNKPENQRLFIDELLHAKLLAPVVITPPPTVDENGERKMTKENKMTFPMMKDKEGKFYFALYTDLNEMRQLKVEGYMTVVPISFKSMVNIAMSNPENFQGIALNPQGDGMVIKKAFVEKILEDTKKADAEEQEKAEMDDDLVAAEIEAKIEE